MANATPAISPTAADRHDDGVHIGQLVQDLQPDGPLPRDDQFVVIRVDEGHAGLLLQFHRPVMGVVIGAPDQFHLGPQPLGALHFHQGRAVGHADHAADAHAGGRQRHAWAWLPAEQAMTPLARSSAVSWLIL